MDANAAQIAARKIRGVKPPSRRTGARPGGNAGGAGFNAVPTFSSQNGSSLNGSSGGGLFGGGLEGSGAFNFSAPVQGISFGNTSGTSTPDTEEDPRADTTGEEAARRNKPFQIVGMIDPSTYNSSQSFSSAPQRTPLSALSQPNGLGSLPEGEKSNPFQLGRSQSPSTTSFNFGATTQSQPISNMFSFTPAPQATPADTSFRFSTPPPTQDNSTTNMFSFNRNNAQAQPISTGISFGNSMASQTQLPNSFTFGQNSSQQVPSSSSISFSSTPAVSQPTTNSFGQFAGTASPAPTSFFPLANQQPLPAAANLFSNLNQQNAASNSSFSIQTHPPSSQQQQQQQQQQQPPPQPTKSLFEKPKNFTQTSNIFGRSDQPSAPNSNFFGISGQDQAPASTNNFFGAQKEQPAASTSIFQNRQPPGSLFGARQSGTTPSLFGDNSPAATTSNLFGNLNQPPGTSSNVFGHLNQTVPQVNSDNHQEGSNSSSDGASQSFNSLLSDPRRNAGAEIEVNQLNTNSTKEIPASPKPAPLFFNSAPKSNTANATFKPNLFSNPFEANQEEHSILPSIEGGGSLVEDKAQAGQPTQLSSNNLFSSMKPIEAPDAASHPAPSGMFPSLSQSIPTQPTNQNIFAKASIAENSSPSDASIEKTASSLSCVSSQNKELALLQNYFTEMGEIPDSVVDEKCPQRFSDSQKIQFRAAYRLRALNKGIKKYIDATPLGGDFSPAFYHYIARRDEILDACSNGLANLKQTRGEIDLQNSSNKISKTLEILAADKHLPRKSSPLKTQPVMSKTTLERATSPEKSVPETLPPPTASPVKALSLGISTTPRAPPPAKPLFSSLQQSAASTSPISSGKRKAEVQITKDNPTEEDVEDNISNKKPTSFGAKPGSQTSSVFKNILDKPNQESKGPSSPEKKIFSMNKTLSDDRPRTNPFSSLPIPPGASFMAKPGAPTGALLSTAASPDIFAGKAASGFTAADSFVSKSIVTSTAPNMFVPKPASTSTGNSATLKPPTFGSAPGNFLEQFGQKSKKSMADAEKEAMEKAKMEDMDSDDDESEWEAKYKEKREAEKKATEELAKSKRATFVPGKGFIFASAEKNLDLPQPAPISTLGQSSIPSSIVNLFPPINRSGTSSPGVASSRASSVFDSVKPASFGTNNIFGHLSDADSGADSGRGNDADDDSTDGETNESIEEPDEERGDASYDNKGDEAVSPGSPDTPADETGSGIVSAQKTTNLFNLGQSNSGASTPSTPGGSLFDRISKDSNGNPIRQVPSENKENAGPVAAKIFGDGSSLFAKYPKKSKQEEKSLGQDNTWKQDSPIKFRNTTSAPSVEVTSPTPTKLSPFAGIFGSTVLQSASPTPSGTPFTGFGTPKPSSPAPNSNNPFAGLFGNTSAPKPASSLFANLGGENKPPAVGFNFGVASTTTSSLFPSAAGSTTTSRATTPGGTTDGESTNEASGDPDAEHHEQIDLTSGGPGEEDEQVLHTIRAKALKFELSKESGKTEWIVKGLGPLRLLKNKETGSSRILMRADPRGTIVLNKGILGNVTYEATGKTLKLLTAGEGGQGLETWLIQIKTPEGAQELAKSLEENKRKS